MESGYTEIRVMSPVLLKGAGKAPAEPAFRQALDQPDGIPANPRNLMGFLDAFKATAMF
jgi:hypothetical protein